MRLEDALSYARETLSRQRTRSLLMFVAMSIAVGSVLVLTGLGQGARFYVSNQFTSLGTNLVIVFPGRSETAGVSPGLMISKAARDLTIDDAMALRHLPGVRDVAPITVGVAEIKWQEHVRETAIVGSTESWAKIRHVAMREGAFLPPGDPNRFSAVCVIGRTIRHEMFGDSAAVGQWLRIGDRKFRVIGVLESRGMGLGLNNDEIVLVPVAAALALFNSNTLFRILIEGQQRSILPAIRASAEETIKQRHQGELDVTVLTEDAVLGTFDSILVTLTMAVTGIATISLAVAGIMIMNLMLIAVAQRRTEIGLLKALGATPNQVKTLFLSEAALMSLSGGVCGLFVGEIAALALRTIYPTVPVSPPLWAAAAALVLSVATGITFALLPANRAVALDPILALSKR